MSKIIEGVKLIYHNMGHLDDPDDFGYPFKLNVVLTVPKFMEVAAVGIYGSERAVIIGKTKEALEEVIAANDLRNHPRLQSIEITER